MGRTRSFTGPYGPGLVSKSENPKILNDSLGDLNAIEIYEEKYSTNRLNLSPAT